MPNYDVADLALPLDDLAHFEPEAGFASDEMFAFVFPVHVDVSPALARVSAE